MEPLLHPAGRGEPDCESHKDERRNHEYSVGGRYRPAVLDRATSTL
jgi:hypothetical protein